MTILYHGEYYFHITLAQRGAFADGLRAGTFEIPGSENEITIRETEGMTWWENARGDRVPMTMTLTSVEGRFAGTIDHVLLIPRNSTYGACAHLSGLAFDVPLDN